MRLLADKRLSPYLTIRVSSSVFREGGNPDEAEKRILGGLSNIETALYFGSQSPLPYTTEEISLIAESSTLVALEFEDFKPTLKESGRFFKFCFTSQLRVLILGISSELLERYLPLVKYLPRQLAVMELRMMQDFHRAALYAPPTRGCKLLFTISMVNAELGLPAVYILLHRSLENVNFRYKKCVSQECISEQAEVRAVASKVVSMGEIQINFQFKHVSPLYPMMSYLRQHEL